MAGKPAKGKAKTKTTASGKKVSYGQKGASVKPGTSKGDSGNTHWWESGNSRKITVNGIEYRSVMKATEHFSLNYWMVRKRLYSGWTADEAF